MSAQPPLMQPAMPSPFMPKKARIRSIIPLAQDNHLFELTFEDGQLPSPMPGQFFEVWVPGVGEAPISVCSSRSVDAIQLCIRRVGRVTNAIFQMEEGDWVGLRGPYGHGFPVDEYVGKNLVMVAGGLGAAPIRSLWQYVLDRRDKFGKLILVYGLRHSIDLLFRQELKVMLRRHDIDIFIGAEEIVGPDLPPVAAQLGRVTDMIRLADLDESFHAAICGPPIMYKYVVEELRKKGVRNNQMWLSLERHMKCGIGKCGHCFVGGKFTCSKGPVFNLDELRLTAEAIECAD